MRDCAKVTATRSAFAGLLCLALSGCHTPQHSNVLIFATNTKGGIDISYDPKTQEPSLVVGYRRQEGVWMPLLANMGEDGLTPGIKDIGPQLATHKQPAEAARVSTPMPVVDPGRPTTLPDASRTINPGYLYVGTEGQRVDTYSVLASFGAKFSAKGAKASGPEASGALAQYFATGLAARELAREGGARLVSVQPADAVAAEAGYAALSDPALLENQQKLDALLKNKLKDGAKLDNRAFGPNDTRAFAEALAEKKGTTLKTLRRKGGNDLQQLIETLENNVEK